MNRKRNTVHPRNPATPDKKHDGIPQLRANFQFMSIRVDPTGGPDPQHKQAQQIDPAFIVCESRSRRIWTLLADGMAASGERSWIRSDTCFAESRPTLTAAAGMSRRLQSPLQPVAAAASAREFGVAQTDDSHQPDHEKQSAEYWRDGHK